MNKNIVILLCLALAGCKPAQPPSKPGTTSADKARTSAFFCAPGYDYRAFEGLSTFSIIPSMGPEKERTQQQIYDLDPGDPLLKLSEKPDISCTTDHLLQLRYADTREPDFVKSPNRVSITFAPAGRLLDPLLYERARAMAFSLEETKLALDGSECSSLDKVERIDCKKMRHPYPLYFESYDNSYGMLYYPGTEFGDVGKHSWTWHFKRDGYFVEHKIFTTSDGKFDVKLEIERKLSGIDTKVKNGITGLTVINDDMSFKYDERFGLRAKKGEGQKK